MKKENNTKDIAAMSRTNRMLARCGDFFNVAKKLKYIIASVTDTVIILNGLIFITFVFNIFKINLLKRYSIFSANLHQIAKIF